MIENTTNNHKSIVKATGIFGFLQLFKMAIAIVGNKCIAVFIGPLGIGLVSLLNNTVNVILALTQFEFLKTATREIALHNDINDNQKLTKTISLLQKMAIVVGILGAFISLLFCSTLSQLTFGTTQKKTWFIILSFYFFITSTSNARLAILQGINNIKKLALANIVASFFTMLVSIAIYYYLRTEGIVWAMLASSTIMLITTIFFTKQYSFGIYPINFSNFYEHSSPVFKLGFVMSINLILGQLCSLLIKYFLGNNGASLQIIGFYEVSSVIMINYLGLIFNAMSYDFFPKLTTLSNDKNQANTLVNHQIEIAIILVTPAIVLLYLLGLPIIQLLYSKEFFESFLILKLALFSVIIKAVALPFGYLILAKGNKKQYFKQEFFSDVLNLILTVLFYNIWGLTGIGLAYVLNYAFYTLYLYNVLNKQYDFRFLKPCLQLILVNLVLGLLAILIVFSLNQFMQNASLIVLLLFSLYYSFTELNKRVIIKDIFKK